MWQDWCCPVLFAAKSMPIACWSPNTRSEEESCKQILDPQFFFGNGIWIQDVGRCCVRLSLSSSFTKCQSTRKLLIGINLSQTKGQVPKTAPHFLFFSIPVSHSLVLFSIQQQPLNPGLNGSPSLDHLKLFLCLECGTQCDPVVAASSKGHEEDERGRGKRRKKCRNRRKFDRTKWPQPLCFIYTFQSSPERKLFRSSPY